MQLPRLPHLGPRARKIVRVTGIVVAALVVFALALQLTFPYERVKDKLIDALADKYDVTIKEVEPGWVPGRVYFHKVNLTPRPTKPDEVTTPIFIETLEVDIKFLPLLGKKLAADIDARLPGGGRLTGRFGAAGWGQDGITLLLDGEAIPATLLPVREGIGLPLTGKIDLAVAFDLPTETDKDGRRYMSLKKLEAAVDVSCPSGCTFGDGKSKLKPILTGAQAKNQIMVQDGIEFGKLTVDKLVARVEINDGKLTVTKFETKSRDGELHFDFGLALGKTVDTRAPIMQQVLDATVTGCARFHGSESLQKQQPTTFAALQTTGAELRSDGLFHIKFTGTMRMMQKLNLECGPNVHEAQAPTGGPPVRPNLVVHPDEPTRPIPPPQPPVIPAAQPPSVGSATVPVTPAPPSTMTRPPGPDGETGSAMGSAGAAPGSAIMN